MSIIKDRGNEEHATNLHVRDHLYIVYNQSTGL